MPLGRCENKFIERGRAVVYQSCTHLENTYCVSILRYSDDVIRAWRGWLLPLPQDDGCLQQVYLGRSA